MNLMSLQLDEQALSLVGDLLDGLENDDSWIKMTVRIAAQIDTRLKESGYVGTVSWFSESDYIEQEIEYK
ncbi:hypothetical protein [Vibrio tapetis]|uniref:Uncharacterized protein n=1 Tax=Vibrio tapetis subsp. tapetis TaxID=1671868 RepID=A0A2N8ZD93_9VIBR|nr:hypothetical protein [Vibrio tapetis]SON49881.1 conserved protein of unknown function [Vibrio tapetis subsp. tapetis]